MKIKWFDQCVSDALTRLKSNRKTEGKLLVVKLDDCDIYSWPQLVDGKTKQCTVVIGPMFDACVYFDDQFAYSVKKSNVDFWDEVNARNVSLCLVKQYGS